MIPQPKKMNPRTDPTKIYLNLLSLNFEIPFRKCSRARAFFIFWLEGNKVKNRGTITIEIKKANIIPAAEPIPKCFTASILLIDKDNSPKAVVMLVIKQGIVIYVIVLIKASFLLYFLLASPKYSIIWIEVATDKIMTRGISIPVTTLDVNPKTE